MGYKTETTRRSFLKAAPAAAVVAAVPAAAYAQQGMMPFDRARYHYDEFVRAMNELTADTHGWKINGAAETPAFQKVPANSFLNLQLVRYERDTDPRCPALIVERHQEIIGLQRVSGKWRDDEVGAWSTNAGVWLGAKQQGGNNV